MDDLLEQARLSLPHIYWIGGPGCSGKTTTTRLLGRQYGLSVFHVDDELADYTFDPNLRPPQWRDIDYFGKQGRPLFHLPAAEVAAYVIHDWQAPLFRETLRRLLSLPRDRKVIVEGVFLPETLLQVTTPDRIALMTTSRAFHHQYFAHRAEWIAAYSDKAAAYNTVLDALDEMNRQWVTQATQYNRACLRFSHHQKLLTWQLYWQHNLRLYQLGNANNIPFHCRISCKNRSILPTNRVE